MQEFVADKFHPSLQLVQLSADTHAVQLIGQDMHFF